MKLLANIRAGAGVLGARFLSRRAPIVVSLSVTERCAGGCLYCDRRQLKHGELSTREIHTLVRQMVGEGTHFLGITGGEPLLRDDIETIVQHAKAGGLTVGLNTSGGLLPRRTGVHGSVGHITLSLDGPREVHDHVRGQGAFDRAMLGAQACKEHGTRYSFVTVLSAHNLDATDDVLELAREHDTVVVFQPVAHPLTNERDPAGHEPDVVAYRALIGHLMDLKKRGAPVGNSRSGLAYLARWPDPSPIRCAAGRISCRIESDGRMFPCGHVMLRRDGVDVRDHGFAGAFALLAEAGCDACWCGRMADTNLLYSMAPDAIIDAVLHAARF